MSRHKATSAPCAPEHAAVEGDPTRTNSLAGVPGRELISPSRTTFAGRYENAPGAIPHRILVEHRILPVSWLRRAADGTTRPVISARGERMIRYRLADIEVSLESRVIGTEIPELAAAD
jgi:hypothetical protein